MSGGESQSRSDTRDAEVQLIIVFLPVERKRKRFFVKGKVHCFATLDANRKTIKKNISTFFVCFAPVERQIQIKFLGGITQMKTAVIYARYSSDNQTEQSIEGQLRVCEEYAQKNNILILGTYIDRAMTGTNDNRPETNTKPQYIKRLCGITALKCCPLWKTFPTPRKGLSLRVYSKE